MTSFSSSIASTRRTRPTSQMERGVPLSRMALISRLVGACKETSCKLCAANALAMADTSCFSAYSKWLRVQKISRAWKPAPAISPRSSGASFRDTKRYVESSLCIMVPIFPKRRKAISPQESTYPCNLCVCFLLFSVPHRSPIISRVGCAQPLARLRIDCNGVHKPDEGKALGLMAARIQRTFQSGGQLHLHQPAGGHPAALQDLRGVADLRLSSAA